MSQSTTFTSWQPASIPPSPSGLTAATALAAAHANPPPPTTSTSPATGYQIATATAAEAQPFTHEPLVVIADSGFPTGPQQSHPLPPRPDASFPARPKFDPHGRPRSESRSRSQHRNPPSTTSTTTTTATAAEHQHHHHHHHLHPSSASATSIYSSPAHSGPSAYNQQQHLLHGFGSNRPYPPQAHNYNNNSSSSSASSVFSSGSASIRSHPSPATSISSASTSSLRTPPDLLHSIGSGGIQIVDANGVVRSHGLLSDIKEDHKQQQQQQQQQLLLHHHHHQLDSDQALRPPVPQYRTLSMDAIKQRLKLIDSLGQGQGANIKDSLPRPPHGKNGTQIGSDIKLSPTLKPVNSTSSTKTTSLPSSSSSSSSTAAASHRPRPSPDRLRALAESGSTDAGGTAATTTTASRKRKSEHRAAEESASNGTASGCGSGSGAAKKGSATATATATAVDRGSNGDAVDRDEARSHKKAKNAARSWSSASKSSRSISRTPSDHSSSSSRSTAADLSSSSLPRKNWTLERFQETSRAYKARGRVLKHSGDRRMREPVDASSSSSAASSEAGALPRPRTKQEANETAALEHMDAILHYVYGFWCDDQARGLTLRKSASEGEESTTSSAAAAAAVSHCIPSNWATLFPFLDFATTCHKRLGWTHLTGLCKLIEAMVRHLLLSHEQRALSSRLAKLNASAQSTLPGLLASTAGAGKEDSMMMEEAPPPTPGGPEPSSQGLGLQGVGGSSNTSAAGAADEAAATTRRLKAASESTAAHLKELAEVTEGMARLTRESERVSLLFTEARSSLSYTVLREHFPLTWAACIASDLDSATSAADLEPDTSVAFESEGRISMARFAWPIEYNSGMGHVVCFGRALVAELARKARAVFYLPAPVMAAAA